MYWTQEEELELVEMVRQGRSLEDIVERFHRSPEAVMLKVKRLGLVLPQSVEASLAATAQVKPLTAVEDLIDYEEAMRMLLGALKRLGEVDVDRQELKKFRLIISGLKAYCSMWLTLQDLAAVEEKVKSLSLTVMGLVELKRSIESQGDEVKGKTCMSWSSTSVSRLDFDSVEAKGALRGRRFEGVPQERVSAYNVSGEKKASFRRKPLCFIRLEGSNGPI